MAKKKPVAFIKLQIPAGKATPAPPVGSALGPHGVSAPQFVQQFNDRTKKMEPGMVVPVIVSVYSDRSFSFELKTPPAAVLLKKAVGIEKGSPQSHKEKVGTVNTAQLEGIAKTKMPDLNANDLAAGVKIIAGTARSMGIRVEEKS